MHGFVNISSSLTQAVLLPTVNNTSFNWTNTNETTQSCHVWQDVQHILFQLGSLCMAFSFLTPISFQYHVLFLRCLLLFTFLFYILWAGLFICLPDILAWNCAFFFINIAQIFYLAYNMYPVHINKEYEDAYAKLLSHLVSHVLSSDPSAELAALCTCVKEVLMQQRESPHVEKSSLCF